MKKLLSLVLFVGIFAFAQAQESTELVWHTNFNDAKRIAEEQNKPLLMFFTGSDWCGWCKRLQKEVFTQKEFTDWANDNVVLLELDFPRTKQLDKETQTQNYFLQQKLGVRGFPTIWFVSFKKGDQEGIIAVDKVLGSTGYVRGGSKAWLEGAEKIINQTKV